MAFVRAAIAAVAVVAVIAGSALAGLVVTLAAAAVTITPALFLGTGALAALAAWCGGFWLLARRRSRRARLRLVLAGVMAVTLAMVAVNVPLADPVRSPERPPGAGTWELPDGGRLAYGVVRAAPGAAPATPVVVLHGGPGVPDLAGHLTALRPLTADGHDVWAYAQRGAGASSRLADPRRYTTALAVDDLESVRQRIGAERVILLGHSYGAFLAAAYTAAHPERVDALVFSAPGDLHTGGLGGMPQSRLETSEKRRAYALVAAPRAMLAYGLVQVNPAAAHAFAGDREVDARQDRVYATALPAMHCRGSQGRPLYGLGFYANQVPQSARAPAAPDVAAKVEGARVPALVIKPQCDYLDWESATGYLETFPEAELSYLPGAGHDAYLERPDQWLAAVRAFLTNEPVPGVLPDPERPPDSFQRD